MLRIGKLMFLASSALTVFASNASAVNRIRVETLDMQTPGAVVTIGVYVDNDINIQGITIPLEIRTVSGGAYPVTGSFAWGLNPAGRMQNSPLGPAGATWPDANITTSRFDVAATNTCSGPTSNSFAQAAGAIGFTSPDAVFFASVSQGDPSFEDVFLTPGADVQGTPSLRIVTTMGPNMGIFEIDSCCRTPQNHIQFVDANVGVVTPQFTKGRIGINTIAAVKELETGVIPQDYSLEQNYPNPFNAGTVIRFAQPVDGNVKIDVYNILGRKVKTLVNEFRSAGTHQTDWDGRSDDGVQVSTGVYFYRITTDSFSSTRKMVLLK